MSPPSSDLSLGVEENGPRSTGQQSRHLFPGLTYLPVRVAAPIGPRSRRRPSIRIPAGRAQDEAPGPAAPGPPGHGGQDLPEDKCKHTSGFPLFPAQLAPQSEPLAGRLRGSLPAAAPTCSQAPSTRSHRRQSTRGTEPAAMPSASSTDRPRQARAPEGQWPAPRRPVPRADRGRHPADAATPPPRHPGPPARGPRPSPRRRGGKAGEAWRSPSGREGPVRAPENKDAARLAHRPPRRVPHGRRLRARPPRSAPTRPDPTPAAAHLQPLPAHGPPRLASTHFPLQPRRKQSPPPAPHWPPAAAPGFRLRAGGRDPLADWLRGASVFIPRLHWLPLKPSASRRTRSLDEGVRGWARAPADSDAEVGRRRVRAGVGRARGRANRRRARGRARPLIGREARHSSAGRARRDGGGG